MNNALQPTLNLARIDDIVYWTKKWEISPNQLFQAVRAIQSSDVQAIAKYLRERGFAL
ncbi:MAG TPA: DUF3606 domain-containing protein [Puia sp.]|nr:DUF3606 domain-containing protein [Puia sp.]